MGPNSSSKELIYVEAMIRPYITRALVDTGKKHDFVSLEKVKRLGFRVVDEKGMLKTINSKSKPIYNVVHDFLDKMKTFPIPFGSAMCMVKEDDACMMPMSRREERTQGKVLSTMQLSKGVKNEEPTYLATLKMDNNSYSTKEVLMEIEKVLNEYSYVMSKELPKKLLSKWEVDHKIELEPGMRPSTNAPYRMVSTELEELLKKLKELLDVGFIQPSKASYGAPVLFQKKKNGSCRLCIDYRALNKVTVKNKYHIPLIADLFDQLGRTRCFTKFNLRSEYYQIRIVEGDEAKTTCVTRYGSFKFLVILFGLTNTPAIFCTLMNNIFHPYLEKFMVIYLDDIIVYNAILEEHTQYLRIMFKILASNQLYMNKEKFSFWT
ncbi:RNA-directed DNA polymerase-like protein [Drosera capensis]